MKFDPKKDPPLICLLEELTGNFTRYSGYQIELSQNEYRD